MVRVLEGTYCPNNLTEELLNAKERVEGTYARRLIRTELKSDNELTALGVRFYAPTDTTTRRPAGETRALTRGNGVSGSDPAANGPSEVVRMPTGMKCTSNDSQH